MTAHTRNEPRCPAADGATVRGRLPAPLRLRRGRRSLREVIHASSHHEKGC